MTAGASPILITLDVDWAPDWMIEEASGALVAAGVRATWFATHRSEAMERLADHPLFEIGIHPNFLAGSSHGAAPDEVMATMARWYPAARAVRTHSLVASEPLLAMMADRYGMAVDCSIHLPRAAHVQPHALTLSQGGAELVRIPHVFQDNMHMLSGQSWDLRPAWLAEPGLKVMNFHPVHLALNSADMTAYERAKALGPMSSLSRAQLPPTGQAGARTFFDSVLDSLAGRRTLTISEAAAEWRAGRLPW